MPKTSYQEKLITEITFSGILFPEIKIYFDYQMPLKVFEHKLRILLNLDIKTMLD